MANLTWVNLCPSPFFDSAMFGTTGGYVQGRLCKRLSDSVQCCLPCPMTDWVYPDSFDTVAYTSTWIATVSVVCCGFLLLSWAALPVEKTNRHYLSICFTIGIMLMSLGFLVPLAAQPDQCFDSITPNDMHSSKACAASGTLLILGGWCGVMWAFVRSLSLHLQICWQVLVGRNFMIFAQAAGWGVPIVGITLALVFSGVSFRFGATCHINHNNSMADLWIPLLVFSCLTVVTTFSTFGYCVKVYLASLSDNAASTAESSLPAYSNSVATMTPRQAYHRVRRVLTLQWRGIAIVLIIVADVIFFSVIFVSQDRMVQSVADDPKVAHTWIMCLIRESGDKSKCFKEADHLNVGEATVSAVLVLLGLNGIWLLFLLGRWTMVTGWVHLVKSLLTRRRKEFVSLDARFDMKKDTRSYEMLSGETTVITPLSSVKSPTSPRTLNYFGQTAGYHAPSRSYSSPRPPPPPSSWHAQQMQVSPQGDKDMNLSGMNRHSLR